MCGCKAEGWSLKEPVAAELEGGDFEMGGCMAVTTRQQCHVHPPYVQLLHFLLYEKVKDRSRVMGCASEQCGTGQGEKLLFLWQGSHGHLAGKK